MNDLQELTETDEQEAARLRTIRTRAALYAAPALAQHVRALAINGKTERGETLAEWSAPMRITAGDDIDEMYAQLIDWVGYWAETLEVLPPSTAIVAARNFQDSHRSAGYADAPVMGFKAGTTAEGAQALTRVLTTWLLIKQDIIVGDPAAEAYQDDVARFVFKVKARYPMNARPEPTVDGRICPTCFSANVHAFWRSEQLWDVEVKCWHCGHILQLPRNDRTGEWQQPVPEQNRLLTVAEAAEWIGVSGRSMATWIGDGRIATMKEGKQKLVRLTDVQQIVRERATARATRAS